MVVCYCPACGTKVFIKGVADGEYPICFTHCGHEISVDLNKEKTKRVKR